MQPCESPGMIPEKRNTETVMTEFKKSTAMSTQRILISLFIFLLMPAIRFLIRNWIGNDTLALMFALNFCVWLLIIYDWELFGLHWLRAKANIPDTLLYSFIGMIVIFIWTYVDLHFLRGTVLLPNPADIRRYPIAYPAVIIAFSFSLSALVNITFKCITDHFKMHAGEAIMILISGFLFGFVYTICITPARPALFFPTYLYNVILICALSYLYNQTHSFIPGILAMGTAYLILTILILF